MVSQAEERLALQLIHAGYHFNREYKFALSIGRQWRADFFLNDYMVIIEVEGIKYGKQGGRHQTAVGITNDMEKYNALTWMGFRLLRFTPAMINGRAKRPNKSLIPPAIDTINEVCLNFIPTESEYKNGGYARVD